VAPQLVEEKNAIFAVEHAQQEQAVAAVPGESGKNSSAGESMGGGEGTAPRKRRRRRRGRRGARENSSLLQPSESGGPPSDEVAGAEKTETEIIAVNEGEHASVNVSSLSTSAIIPNAPSEPVWSFEPENRHGNGAAERSPTNEVADDFRTETKKDEGPSGASVPEVLRRENEPAEPPRKGWWQRPFRKQ
jgi:ribonuclease E